MELFKKNNKKASFTMAFILSVITLLFSSPGYCFSNKNLKQINLDTAFVGLEKTFPGIVGVYAYDTGKMRYIAYRADERFPLCSTFKAMGAAAILKKSETNPDLLNKVVHYKKSDLVSWSPVSETKLNTGATLQELAKAAVTQSDSTAINLIMQELGGPSAINAFARSIHDNTFYITRWEPEMNNAKHGDIPDTSSPKAMASSMNELLFNEGLARKQQQLFKTWLIENTTGNKRIRAGTPVDWIVGDKTGTCGNYGATNDVGVIWPKDGAPIVIAVYVTQNQKDAHPKDVVIAEATRIVLNAFSK